MSRKLIGLLVTAAALGLPTSAAGQTPTKDFRLSVTSAKLSVAGLPPFAIDSAQLAKTPISIVGTAEDDGRLAAPVTGLTLPKLDIPLPPELLSQLTNLAGGTSGLPSVGGFNLGSLLSNGSLSVSVSAGLKPAGPASGTISRTTGVVQLDLPIDIEVAINGKVLNFLNLPLISCKLPALAFAMKSEPTTLSDGTVLAGERYASKNGTAVLTGQASVPSPTCSGLLASFLGDALNGIGSAVLGKVGLQLSANVTLPPAAVASLPGLAKVAIAADGTMQSKVVCSRTRSCRGTAKVKMKDGTIAGSGNFNIAAGKSTLLKIKLARSLKLRMKRAATAAASIEATVGAGVDVRKQITLLRPRAWR